MMTQEDKIIRQRAANRASYARHRESRLAASNAYHKANKERDKVNGAAYRKSHPEKSTAKNKAWRKSHPEKSYEYTKRWRKSNPSKTRAIASQYRSLRRRKDSSYRLLCNLRAYIGQVIRERPWAVKRANSRVLVGCTIETLKKYIESLWKSGMSWENYGLKGWHIDHVRPCASFDMTDPEQQKACFHWSNLQPLWAAENIRKSDKWNIT